MESMGNFATFAFDGICHVSRLQAGLQALSGNKNTRPFPAVNVTPAASLFPCYAGLAIAPTLTRRRCRRPVHTRS